MGASSARNPRATFILNVGLNGIENITSHQKLPQTLHAEGGVLWFGVAAEMASLEFWNIGLVGLNKVPFKDSSTFLLFWAFNSFVLNLKPIILKISN